MERRKPERIPKASLRKMDFPLFCRICRSNFVRLLPKGRKNSAASINASLQLALSLCDKNSYRRFWFLLCFTYHNTKKMRVVFFLEF